MMKCFEIFIVDAFASKSFTGNPAAVCLVGYGMDLGEDEKQKIATEMNQAETAFIQLLKPADTFSSASEFKLQWFTPVMEVNLCGHATLASSATLFKVKRNKNETISYQTRGGTLIAKKKGDCIAINLPLNPCNAELPDNTEEIVRMAVGSRKPVDIQFAPGANSEILIRLSDDMSRSEFEAICPDQHGLLQVYNFKGAPGVILTVKGNRENGAVDENGRPFDFLSRYFDPWNGIPEDPVTGAAHCVLASYWQRVLGKNIFYARQCSKRGGNVDVNILNEDRVELAGTVAVIFKGTIKL